MPLRAIAILAVSALAVSACGGKSDPGAAKSAPVARVQNPKPEAELASITLSEASEKHLALRVEEVVVQPVRNVRSLGGEVIVPPGQAVTVFAPFAGTLTLAAGRSMPAGSVTKGSVLFELLPLQSTDRDSRIAADRSLSEATARLNEANQRLTRLQTLLTEGSASVRAVEEARANRDVANAAVQAARSQLAAIERLPVGPRGEIALTAPLNGQIVAMRVAPGQTVSAGAPIAEISNIDVTWLRVPVYAGDLASLDLDHAATVTALGKEMTGPWTSVQRIAGPPSADPNAASVDLYYQLPQSGRRPGERMAVRIALKSSTGDRALVVPASAVVYDLTGGTWVYESKSNHVYARRRVELAGLAGSELIVRRGLTAGVKIVTVGAAELYGTEFYVSK